MKETFDYLSNEGVIYIYVQLAIFALVGKVIKDSRAYDY